MSLKTVFALIFSSIILVSIQAQNQDQYYFSKTIDASFDETNVQVRIALKEQSFGIITEIEMDKTLKEKLDGVEMKPYTILGACNPKFAYETLQHEENIGLFLPCKVLIKYVSEHQTEVVMVNPSALMKMLGNEELMNVAEEVSKRFQLALDAL